MTAIINEISGTNAWLEKYPEKRRNIIGTLNFDMEGIRIAQSRSYWVLQRTPDTFPSYINDIAQSMMEYIADISRERVRFRRSITGYAPSQPVEAIHGSKDAFYIKIDKHYGSSVPGHNRPVIVNWPSMRGGASGAGASKSSRSQRSCSARNPPRSASLRAP